MKKILSIAVAACLMAGLSACNDTTSPEGVVQMAAKALNENNLKDFTQTLSGNALAAYGNAEGMAKLKEKLNGYELSTGVSWLTTTVSNDMGLDKLRIYVVPVMGKSMDDKTASPKALLKAMVTCNLSYTYDDDEGHGREPGMTMPPHYSMVMSAPAPSGPTESVTPSCWDEDENCTISDIL